MCGNYADVQNTLYFNAIFLNEFCDIHARLVTEIIFTLWSIATRDFVSVVGISLPVSDTDHFNKHGTECLML